MNYANLKQGQFDQEWEIQSNNAHAANQASLESKFWLPEIVIWNEISQIEPIDSESLLEFMRYDLSENGEIAFDAYRELLPEPVRIRFSGYVWNGKIMKDQNSLIVIGVRRNPTS